MLLNRQIGLFHSNRVISIDLINRLLNLFTLLFNQGPIKLKFLLPIGKFRVLSITTKFISFSIQLVNSSIGNPGFILKTSFLSKGTNETVVGSRIVNKIRIRSRRIGSKTSTTGGTTKNSLRGNTGTAPLVSLPSRVIFLLKIIHLSLPIVILQGHVSLITALIDSIADLLGGKRTSSSK